MKKILFSPIGNTDPITGQRDGALLHITRIYKPDIIYLYMSKEICEHDEKDNRYEYCLEQLKSIIDADYKIEKIKRPELVDVHIFDYFINEFDEIIKGLCGEDVEVLVNVSSGTPAMKSALQTIATISENKITPIQVATPVKASNDIKEDVKGDYDVQVQWECNLDNDEDLFKDRSYVSSNINMSYRIKKEIIAKHILAYDYTAADSIAESMKDFISEEAKRLIKIAKYRAMLNKDECAKLMNKESFDVFPQKSSDKKALVEYLLCMKIKIKREEYIEFMRAISPLFSNLLEMTIKNTYNFDLPRYYMKQNNLNGVVLKRWNKEEGEKSPIIVENCTNKNGVIEGNVETRQLVGIIESLNRNLEMPKDIGFIKDIREVERNIRNPLAHGITYINDEIVKSVTGFNVNQIFKKLIRLFKYAGIPMDEEIENSYEYLNQEIISRL